LREVWPLEAKGLAALPPQVMRRGRATLLQRQPRQHQAHLAVRLMAKRRRLHNPPSDPHAPKPVHRQTRDLQDQGGSLSKDFQAYSPVGLGTAPIFAQQRHPLGALVASVVLRAKRRGARPMTPFARVLS